MYFTYEPDDDGSDVSESPPAAVFLPMPSAAPPQPADHSQVVTAFNFIAMCNQQMGTRCWINPLGEPVVRDMELHPAQEGAFRLACQVLGNYFKQGR